VPFHVYVLELEGKQRFYIGYTQNLENRLRQHLSGETHSLRGHKILRVAHVEEFSTRTEAMARERYLKTYRGRSKLRTLIGDA
jgi:putative endonuclease